MLVFDLFLVLVNTTLVYVGFDLGGAIDRLLGQNKKLAIIVKIACFAMVVFSTAGLAIGYITRHTSWIPVVVARQLIVWLSVAWMALSLLPPVGMLTVADHHDQKNRDLFKVLLAISLFLNVIAFLYLAYLEIQELRGQGLPPVLSAETLPILLGFSVVMCIFAVLFMSFVDKLFRLDPSSPLPTLHQKILETLQGGPMSAREVAERIQASVKAVRRALAALRNIDRVVAEGVGRNARWRNAA